MIDFTKGSVFPYPLFLLIRKISQVLKTGKHLGHYIFGNGNSLRVVITDSDPSFQQIQIGPFIQTSIDGMQPFDVMAFLYQGKIVLEYRRLEQLRMNPEIVRVNLLP